MSFLFHPNGTRYIRIISYKHRMVARKKGKHMRKADQRAARRKKRK
ncbi:MAG: hypothetical protein ACREA7_10065 [Nitrosotalea sp.]